MENIYKEYSKIVFNYLLSLTNNTDLAEELMQETFYSAIKNIRNFRQESSLKTWLCKIAKNKWIDYYKKVKKVTEIDIDNINDYLFIETSFEEEFANKDDILNLYKKIHNLDEKTKEVIYLRIRAEFSFRDISIIMGCSEDWARITFYRAKLKLKEEYENE